MAHYMMLTSEPSSLLRSLRPILPDSRVSGMRPGGDHARTGNDVPPQARAARQRFNVPLPQSQAPWKYYRAGTTQQIPQHTPAARSLMSAPTNAAVGLACYLAFPPVLC